MKILWSLMGILLLLFNTEAQNTGQGISLSQVPADGKTTPGHDVIFTCTVDLNILADFYLVWTRHTGSVHTKIAEGTLKQDDFLDNKRYKLSKHRSGVKKEYYTLTISDVQLEDSGTIECSILHSSRKDTRVLAVCDDTSSDSCSCVHSIGWLSPQCYGETKSVKDLQKAFNRSVTGLGVCFAIAVIYGVLITVFFARDCMKIIYKKNQMQIAKLKNQQQGYNPYVDSDKLTVEDDLGSIPESGVWSQSDGRNGSDRSAGRSQPVQVVTDTPRENLPVSERPVVNRQYHTNPAFNPDDASVPHPVYDAVADMPSQPAGGVRPKVPKPQLRSLPESGPPHPEPSHADRREPYRYPEQDLAPAEYYNSSGNGHPSADLSAPSSVRSERCMPPERPPPPQRSYTDVPAEKNPSGYHSAYTSPRRLEFGPSSSLYNGTSAPYVDEHDTVI